MGFPTVTIATTEFFGLAKDTAMSLGVPDAPFVVVPHPMGMIAEAEIEKKAENAFAEIVKTATDWKPSGKLPEMRAAYPADRFTFRGSVDELNSLFFTKGWSLGLPVVPPTADRVKEMLKGTSLKPDYVIGRVPPRMGALTVELAAAHAVMAGCKPEYMPVLIAALRAMLDPRANWRGATTTTGTTSLLVIVNGPIVREIGIASSQGAAGAEHHANASIGYALNLIADIVGGSKPPSPDKSTLGAPSDFVPWIFGENEDRLPEGWEPFHVKRGFKKTDSVVTVMAIYPPVENIDHWSVTPEEHLTWWGHLATPLVSIGGPCWISQMDQIHLVGIGPEHAQLVADAGWTADQYRNAFWEKARLPFSVWPKGCPNVDLLAKKLGPLEPNTPVPVTFSPDHIQTLIAGGAGKHSHYFAPFPGCFPVSVKVEK